MPLGRYAKSLAAVNTAKTDAAKALLQEAERKVAEAAAAKAKAVITAPPKPAPEDDFPDLMNWIYSIPYSRRLIFIPSDFSDGVLIAEIVKHFVPQLVDLHNYRKANGRIVKRQNWEILNRKIFPQLGFRIGLPLIEQIIYPKRFNVRDETAQPYPIEKLLKQIQERLAKINNTVYDYRKNPDSGLDPFKKKDNKRPIRPISRQPMTETMWRLERQEAAKYGVYKGNPITWDSLPNEEAEVAMSSVGISKQKFERLNNERKAMQLKKAETEAEEARLQALKSKESEKAEKSTEIIPADPSAAKDEPQCAQDRAELDNKQRQVQENPPKTPDNRKNSLQASAGNANMARPIPSRSYGYGFRADSRNGNGCVPWHDNLPPFAYYHDMSNFD